MDTAETEQQWRLAYTDDARSALLSLTPAVRETVQRGMDQVSISDPRKFGRPETYSPDRRSAVFGVATVTFWITDPARTLTVVGIEPSLRIAPRVLNRRTTVEPQHPVLDDAGRPSATPHTPHSAG